MLMGWGYYSKVRRVAYGKVLYTHRALCISIFQNVRKINLTRNDYSEADPRRNETDNSPFFLGGTPTTVKSSLSEEFSSEESEESPEEEPNNFQNFHLLSSEEDEESEPSDEPNFQNL
jgi:hypothetical protein